jgi:TonB-linked SusC/RagA family outer membrane protein
MTATFRAGPTLGGLALAFLLVAPVQPVLGQGTGTIRGTVRNSADNSPISGAQVTIGALRLGVVSNDDGRYSLENVPVGSHTLTVHFLGFATERRENVQVVAGQPVVVDFVLKTQVLSMAEIVVTGVTEATSRAKLPFTVAKVSREAMPVPPKAAVAAIQGKVAGATVIQSAEPGGGASILLRSPTSINKNTSPMIVVDGAILTASSTDISALDIESIEIIKGAAAASLYGSRAASGVIQIRTTRGSSIQEGRTRFSIRSEYGANAIMNPIQWATHHNLRMNADRTAFLNAAGQPVERQFAAPSQYLFQDQPYPGKVYDQIDAFFDPGDFMTNSFTLGYNGGNTSWMASGSQHHTSGVVLGNDGYRRYDFRVNLDHRLRNDVSISLSAFHLRSKQEDLAGDPFFDFIHQAPDINLRQPDPDGTPYAFQPDPVGIRVNPLYQIVTQEHWNRRARTLASLDLRYNPLSWLAMDLNGSYDRNDNISTDYVPRGVKTPESPNGGIGSSSRASALTTGINASAGLSVARDFGLLRTRTSARLLIEREDNETVSAGADNAAVGGIPDLDAFLALTNGSSETATRSRGYYVTSDLDYNDRFIVSTLLRRDGSSLFGPEDRWHWYYRASGAWRLSSEPWWPFAATLNEFKLHYSRGTAGGRPNFSDRFEVFGLGSGGLTLGTLGNIFLKPEKTTEQEFGLTAVALQRYSLTLVYAKQRTVDQLITVPLPALYGFTSQWQNAGTIEGHTIEATFETRLIDRTNLSWSMNVIADRSRNEIVEYNRPCHTDGLGNRCAGEQLGEMYARKWINSADELPATHASSHGAFQVNDDGLLVPVGAGNTFRDGVTKNLWGTNVVIDGVTYAWGMPILLRDSLNQIARVKVGSGNPDLNWGVANQFRLGRLNLYALVGGQIGGDVYNATKQRMYQYTRNGEIDQVGKPDDLKKPTTYYTTLYNGNSDNNWFVEDASYIKLREVSLRYAVDPRRLPLVRGTGVSNIFLSLIGRNLWISTDYSGYDPEIGGILNRQDSFNYPTYRTITASVQIEF